jgi:arsenate reductase
MAGDEKIIIYHNPACGTSRNVLALLRERGVEPEIVEYLKTPPSHPALKEITKHIPIRELLRKKGTPYEELGLDNPQWTDAQLTGFILRHPILMNRPVVVAPKGTKLCRPAETVLDLL